jgi:hypothetical protein
MEAVVHAGGEAQRDVAAIAVTLDQCRVAEQVKQGVGEALGLKEFDAGNLAAGADDAVARAGENGGVVIPGARRVSVRG